MSIVSTSIEQYPQASGAIDIVERHTDHLGHQHMRCWTARGHDIEAQAASHASEIEAELAALEIAEILG